MHSVSSVKCAQAQTLKQSTQTTASCFLSYFVVLRQTGLYSALLEEKAHTEGLFRGQREDWGLRLTTPLTKILYQKAYVTFCLLCKYKSNDLTIFLCNTRSANNWICLAMHSNLIPLDIPLDTAKFTVHLAVISIYICQYSTDVSTVQRPVQYSCQYSTAASTVQLSVQYSCHYSTAVRTVQLPVQ